jgi:hypothetical protein
MICSVIIPTRKRPSRLLACVESVWKTVKDRAQVEIIVRMSRDDEASQKVIPKLTELGCLVIVGQVLDRYDLHNQAIDEAVAKSSGQWTFGLPDDSVILGPCDWVAQLAGTPAKTFVIPGIHENGGSCYAHDAACGVFAAPVRCWEPYVGLPVPLPPDTGIRMALLGNGWKYNWFEGLTYHHFNEPHV